MFDPILPDPPAGGAFEPKMGTAESGTAGGPSGLEPIELDTGFDTAGIQPFEADAGGIAPPPSVVGADELQLSPTLLDEIPIEDQFDLGSLDLSTASPEASEGLSSVFTEAAVSMGAK